MQNIDSTEKSGTLFKKMENCELKTFFESICENGRVWQLL